MVDLNIPPTPPMGESSKIKSLMGRTPGILKSKFLTVLGNSNELLNGISNRLTLSISSSDSDYCDDDEEEVPQYDETIDYTKIDFESRRVKARRAHEEIISGRYRHPNWEPKARLDTGTAAAQTKPSSSSSSSSGGSMGGGNGGRVGGRGALLNKSRCISIDSKSTHDQDIDIDIDIEIENDLRKINELLNTTPAIDVESTPYHLTPPPPPQTQSATTEFIQNDDGKLKVQAGNSPNNGPSKTSNSSTLTSLHDPVHASPSLESTDWKNYIRSESQNSVPSWASSISLDDHKSDDPAKEFMRKFADIMFTNPSTIGLELKSEFGQIARQEAGRLWFCRYVMAQKLKSKRVDEITFYSLVQNFAIILFESTEAEDYTPAASVMNMCFTFYHEIEVPGCEPYREYLFTYLRQQPIWHTLRFWNAAFNDAIQSKREQRMAVSQKKRGKNNPNNPWKSLSRGQSEGEEEHSDSSSSSSHHSFAASGVNDLTDNKKFQQHIAFQQLGTFTCNMHSLGISKDLCIEFLIKQNNALRLPKDKVHLIRDNINRMYHETDLWGAKES
ncbi:uncharacterized protein KIAA0513 [Episyrphus balteatus]|uniref:uncharacterized protein KIAA0513 n=1 Tax=Episyrphus balteatus TaxID=286459 RepID=UPI002485C32F|nr:uncharacterized protein KIAA0513 [Episyrphus balteatus]